MAWTHSVARGASRLTQRLWQVLFVMALGFPGAASALLLDRGPNMVYDTVLNITWVRDAALCLTLNNCVQSFTLPGVMNWADANTWAENLVYAGFNDWRLPYASVAAGRGPTSSVVNCATSTEMACRDNEMGYMFYHNLGGTFGHDKTGNQTAVGGAMLINIQPTYWSATEHDPTHASIFFFFDGGQFSPGKNQPGWGAWAVRTGDVGLAAATPVREPTSLWLLGMAALGLALSRRRARRC